MTWGNLVSLASTAARLQMWSSRRTKRRTGVCRRLRLAAPLCWLPEPQERVVLPPMPGKRDDGKLWLE